MGEILVGTASWTDKSLIDSGRFYPRGCNSAEDRLRYYASQFPIVEVDSTYYAMPSQRNSELWVERTPADFTFNIKAFRLFTTHQTQARVIPRGVREALPTQLFQKKNLYYRDIPTELRQDMWMMFREAVGPLWANNELGVILFQFPPWFMPTRQNLAHILECQQNLPDFKMAVEFRNDHWLKEDTRDQTFGFLRENKLAFVAVDEPQGFKSSVPPLAEVTADVALVRFHGRNAEKWEAKGLQASAERFDYYYSREELLEWVPKINAMQEQASDVHVIYNTNRFDQGPSNARLMANLLEGT